MKNRAVVSERGTITIPQALRDYAHIQTGDLIEFETLNKDKIILRHLIVNRKEEESFLTDAEWDKFDEVVQKQLKKGRYKHYTDLEKAKAHSRKLQGKSKGL